jgi:hypothetical protein
MKRLSRILAWSIGLLLMISSTELPAQVLRAVDVHLNIREKVAEEVRVLSRARLVISDVGEVRTDDNGSYQFTYPIRHEVDPVISISLISEDHKMLKPIDGQVELDGGRDEIAVEFLVVNVGMERPEFLAKVEQLEERISKLKQRNRFTVRQLNNLNSTLVDTIMYYEANRVELENQIEAYQKRDEVQRSQIATLQEQVDNLESQVDQLTLTLEQALEERYLRQNQFFQEISELSTAYLRKARDIKDHLAFISTYFNAGNFDNYAGSINSYNETFSSLDNRRLSLIEGVSRYWEDKSIALGVEEVLNFLVKSIHQDQMLTAVNSISKELGKQKPKKAQKMADACQEDITANLDILEQKVNSMLLELRRSL